MSRKRKLLSLSGSNAVAHFSLSLLIVLCQRYYARPDGSVHWNNDNCPVLEFLSFAMIAHMFPIGWLSLLTGALHPTADIIFTVILVAVNSAFVGYVLAWIVCAVYSSFTQRPIG
jgi:hypothetical protein